MAFIREYSTEGDPFLKRAFRKMRKLKVGRALGKVGRGAFRVARVAAPFAVGGLAGGLVGRAIAGRGGRIGRLLQIAEKWGVSPEVATDFARTYGIDPEAMEGDPLDDDTEEAGVGMSGYMGDDDDLGLEFMGDPGAPKPARKRKTAGSGPKVKAQKKRAKRRERAARRRGPGALERGLSKVTRGLGGLAGQLLPGALGGMGEILKKSGEVVPGGNAEDAALAEMMGAMTGKKPRAGAAFRFGAKRRTMNPVNVKALRRSIRRVEGFQTVVKRIQKAYPALRGQATMRSTPRRARGHRAGCACVVCKRAA